MSNPCRPQKVPKVRNHNTWAYLFSVTVLLITHQSPKLKPLSQGCGKLPVSSLSDWKVKLTAPGWWKTLADGPSAISISIDSAAWGLAGGARSKVLLFGWVEKGRGGAGDLTHDWWPVDRFRSLLRFMTELRLWPPKPHARWSICYLRPGRTGHSCSGSQWGHCRKNPGAFWPLSCCFLHLVAEKIQGSH